MRAETLGVTFAAGGVELEGILGRVRGARGAPAVAICHPHPLMGGSMHNNVVMGLFQEFLARGWVTLAFNFRGTGRSGGRHEGGDGEILDALGALDWLAGLPETAKGKLALAGYSFGAWIALQACARAAHRIPCAGAVAPPVGILPFDFLHRCAVPLALVWGDRDPFCPSDRVLRLLEHLPADPARCILPGADHFLAGAERQAAAFLCERFAPFLQDDPPRAQG